MKKTNTILAAVMALTMVGCNEVPEDVKSRTEERNSILETAENKERTGEIRYIPLSEMRADIDAALKEKYTNFTLRDGINVRLPDKLTVCEFVQTSDWLKEYDRIRKVFLDDTEVEGLTVTNSDFTRDQELGDDAKIRMTGVSDPDKKVHFVVWDNGTVVMAKGDVVGNGQLFLSEPTYKIYRVDRGDDLSDKYVLGHREYSVKEAVEAAQKWVDEKIAPLEPDYEMKVNFAKVMKNDMDEYSFAFNVEKLYKQVKLENHLLKYSDSASEKKHKLLFEMQKMSIIMKSGLEPEFFSTGGGTVKPVEIGTLEKGVSLSSALEHIEKKFTDFNNPLTITDIQLKYTLSPDYDETKANYDQPGTKINSRLVWEFEIAVPENELKNADMNGYGDVCKYITVDAENGDVDFCFDLNVLGEE